MTSKDHKRALTEEQVHQVWHQYLNTGTIPDYAEATWYSHRNIRRLAKYLPSDPRCVFCHYPFEGFGGKLVKAMFGLDRSDVNPNVCNVCAIFGAKYQGGAEIDMSMLFVDVRGSTTLAEKMSSAEFSRLIHRFYRTATSQIFSVNGWVEKLIGDEVTGMFVPGFAGPEHARRALEAAAAILHATGYGDAEEPWIPVGVGVHTGKAFVGSVAVEGSKANITALGDDMNIAARLTSLAGQGKVVFSDDVARAVGADTTGLESRSEQVKGRNEPIDIWTANSAELARVLGGGKT